jgi:hypothetical protein
LFAANRFKVPRHTLKNKNSDLLNVGKNTPFLSCLNDSGKKSENLNLVGSGKVQPLLIADMAYLLFGGIPDPHTALLGK